MRGLIRLILIFIFLVLIFSCGYPELDRPWYVIKYKKPKNYDLITINNIVNHVNNSIKYKEQNLVHHPQIYIDTKNADCVGFSLVTLAMVYKELGIKGSLLQYNTKGTDFIQTHTCIKIGDTVYFKKLKKGECTNLIIEIPFDDIEMAYKFII